MPPKRKETTEAKRQILINLRELQKSIRQIWEIVKRPYSTFKKIIDESCALSEVQKHLIIREIKTDPKLPATKLTKAINTKFGYNLCVNTFRNVLNMAELRDKMLLSITKKTSWLRYILWNIGSA